MKKQWHSLCVPLRSGLDADVDVVLGVHDESRFSTCTSKSFGMLGIFFVCKVG